MAESDTELRARLARDIAALGGTASPDEPLNVLEAKVRALKVARNAKGGMPELETRSGLPTGE
jgi:hypothetical protein